MTAESGPLAGLRDHLVTSRLAGRVATSPRSTLRNCAKLVAGRPKYTFGLSDWRTATIPEAVAAVRALCGGDPARARAQSGPGWIDPDSALRAIAGHRDRLSSLVAAGGGRVLLATGHPTGLLAHYGAIARALRAAGCEVLAPLDDTTLLDLPAGRRGLRFFDGVACVFDGGALRHTHLSRYMEAMLDALGGGPGAVDLVIGDHGMAGAAIERGIPTLSIADVNDPALPLAQARGRTDGVLPIDDNLAPSLFVPVTEAVLSWCDRCAALTQTRGLRHSP
ncbi:MAG: phosphatase [Actinomycetota bacterium]|nr:phosphatase [Actinomycetota bacterium]